MGVPLWVRDLRNVWGALWWAGGSGDVGAGVIVDEGTWLKWDTMGSRGQGHCRGHQAYVSCRASPRGHEHTVGYSGHMGTVVFLEQLRGVLQHLVVLPQLQLTLAVVEHQRCDQALQLQPAFLPWLLLPNGASWRCSSPYGGLIGQGRASRDGGRWPTLAWRFLRQMTASWYFSAACWKSFWRTRRFPSLCSTGTAASFSSLLMAQVSRL